MYQKRLNSVMENALSIPFDDSSKFIIMSDCHRGVDSHSDNFSKNQNLYFTALSYYLKCGYTYIELGDGDELWENRQMEDILKAHSDSFWLLSEFYKKNRLYMLFGNHDTAKRTKPIRASFNSYCDGEKKCLPLLPDIEFHEGLLLNYKPTNEAFFLFHGHQADFFNDRLWLLSRFLTRYLWRPLETYGVLDTTSAAKNYTKKDRLEKRIANWAENNNIYVIAGHTHRPSFPSDGSSLYFNDGSCVHPRCITGIEIDRGDISLVKWAVKVNYCGILYVDKEIIEGPMPVARLTYYKNIKNKNNN